MTVPFSAGLDFIVPVRVFPKIQPDFRPVSHHFDSFTTPQPTILDPAKYRQPLLPFNHATHANNFGASCSKWDSESDTPVRPSCFEDDYLSPTLSENEYARLTMLWYYTSGVQQDAELLDKFAQMLEIVKGSLGWEIALVGLVDAETFTRVAAKNLPLATAPRRESPCSHTVNQRPGTVFTILDMKADWRFQGSPQAKNGLRSYAGTQMRLSLQNGEQVSLGTLCVASVEQQPALTEEQKASLVGIADVIMGEIISRKRVIRLQERQSMLECLTPLRAKAHAEYVESEILAELRERYPSCSPLVAKIHKDSIVLSEGECILWESLPDGLWEDTKLITKSIESSTFESAIKDQKIRIVAARITPNERALVLATSKLKCIFDDLDVWFVDQCAQIINASAQARLLREALAAKNTFLRSVTHELRTPIHAILSSVELATEAIASRNQVSDPAGPPLDSASLGPFLDTIRRSSTELMTTVNNILRLNAFVNDMKSFPTEYSLLSLETDVLDEIFANYTDDQLPALAVRFDNKIPDAFAMVKIDGNLLKELLKCLILNAIAAAPGGSILVTMTLLEEENSIVFDLVDTGVGIAEADQKRIFQAFEKVNPHSPGAGLGLSLASQMASTLEGKLFLVSSKPEEGAHFRIHVPHVSAKVAKTSTRRWSSRSRHLAASYSISLNSKRNLHLVEHLENYLQRHNFRKSDTARGALVITNQPEPFQESTAFLRGVSEPHAVLFVCDTPPTKAFLECLTDEFKPHLVVPVMGPLYASRLDGFMGELDHAFQAHMKARNPSRPRLQPPPANNAAPVICAEMLATPPATPGTELIRPILTGSSPTPIPIVKALLVDDNKVNLSVLQMYCKRRKLSHGVAYDGNEAVAEYCRQACGNDRNPYTIVFMDLQMPHCDGVEASRQIREYEQQHNLPKSTIFILTGQDSVADRRGAFEAGVDDYFVKPVSIKKLDQAIGQYSPISPK